MKVFIYSVYDTKMECFHPPFIATNRAVAERQFHGELCTNPQLPYGKYPNDYCLYEIGSFDDHSGQVEGMKIYAVGFAKDRNKENEKKVEVVQ